MTDAVSRMFVFQIELCLYSVVLTATCHFVAFYMPFLNIPGIVFMCTDALSAMLVAHIIALVLIFSMHRKFTDGIFTDSIVAEISQGFTVVSSLLWYNLLGAFYMNMPYITATPGGLSSASAVSISVVLGFYTIVPYLALIATYIAIPDGFHNSILFNGSTLGAASLFFFVFVSFGSVGVTRCPPFSGVVNSILFTTLVGIYWVMLFLVEIAVLKEWDPIGFWKEEGEETDNEDESSGFIRNFKDFSVRSRISYWRVVGGLLDTVIVCTAIAFSNSDIHGTAALFVIFIIVAHIPLIFRLDWGGIFSEWFKKTPTIDSDQTAIAVRPNPIDEKRLFMPSLQPFPFNAAASAGINSRVMQTLPRQRRGVSTDRGSFY